MKVLLVIILSLGLAGFASADSVWTYAGNKMNGSSFSGTFADCGCALDGTVTLDANFKPVSWSFTDGTHTLNSSDSTMKLNPFYFGSPQSNSPFQRWYLDIIGSGVEFLSWKFADPSNYVDQSIVGGSGFGYEAGNAGVWTDPVATAEPATGILVALSLAVAGLMRRRKKKPLESAVWENLA